MMHAFTSTNHVKIRQLRGIMYIKKSNQELFAVLMDMFNSVQIVCEWGGENKRKMWSEMQPTDVLFTKQSIPLGFSCLILYIHAVCFTVKSGPRYRITELPKKNVVKRLFILRYPLLQDNICSRYKIKIKKLKRWKKSWSFEKPREPLITEPIVSKHVKNCCLPKQMLCRLLIMRVKQCQIVFPLATARINIKTLIFPKQIILCKSNMK